MSTYKPYPKTKDSGVEWLGDVPEHWKVAPFKWQIDRNDGGVWGDDPDGTNDTIVLRSTEQTVNGHWKLDDPAPRKLSKSEINSALLVEGDLLLTKSSGSSLHIGKTTLVTAEIETMRCCYSNFMQRIRTAKSFTPELAWYVMNNDLARLQFDILSNSSTGLANLNGTMVGQIIVPVAPLPEQRQIAAFLDRECGKLDALQAKQERLIELLKEKRQALISHAVTRGLDPAAKLKPSGIAWLGDVPEHWAVRKLGLIGTFKGGAGFPDNHQGQTENEIPFFKVGDIVNSDSMGVMRQANHTITRETAKLLRAFIFPSGTVVFAKVGAALLLKRFRTLGQASCIDNNMMGMFAGKDTLADFLIYVLPLLDFELIVNPGAVPSINEGQISSQRIALPPLAEQRAIVAHLDEKCGKIDQLAAKAERAIELLKERRSALISAAVTGKIDVRETLIDT